MRLGGEMRRLLRPRALLKKAAPALACLLRAGALSAISWLLSQTYSSHASPRASNAYIGLFRPSCTTAIVPDSLSLEDGVSWSGRRAWRSLTGLVLLDEAKLAAST
ncbi:hypothetical protein BJY59DRAFT_686273 [Rhodotorula toruloides]